MEDSKIVDLYWSRSENAITETNKKYGRYCYYIAYQILCSHEDAEEVVSDTYLKTWNTIPPKKPDPLKPYVGTISRNEALDRYDKRNAEKRGEGQLAVALDELSECVSDHKRNEDIDSSIDLQNALNKFIASLNFKTRNIFVRRYWYMSSVSEIAEDFRMKESNVKMLLMRTRNKLKVYLEKEGFKV